MGRSHYRGGSRECLVLENFLVVLEMASSLALLRIPFRFSDHQLDTFAAAFRLCIFRRQDPYFTPAASGALLRAMFVSRSLGLHMWPFVCSESSFATIFLAKMGGYVAFGSLIQALGDHLITPKMLHRYCMGDLLEFAILIATRPPPMMRFLASIEVRRIRVPLQEVDFMEMFGAFFWGVRIPPTLGVRYGSANPRR